MSHYEYRTKGTCSQLIHFDLDEGKVHNVQYFGGCPGNLKAISKLVEGMDAEELIAKLSGVRCGTKPTSCSDQLAQAVTIALEDQKKAQA